MKNARFLITLCLLAVLLTACNRKAVSEGSTTIEPTTTKTSTPLPFTPTPTETQTPSPSPTPTATVTVPPTETAVPQPASLTGAVYLSGDSLKPFGSSVELRQRGSFDLVAQGVTDPSGNYKIENIEPGVYDLWVLITTQEEMVTGCSDIAPPADSWKMGIKFGEDKAMTMENAYLSKALFLMQNMPPSSDLKATGFSAVLENFKIESGIENKMDVTLMCK